EFVAPNVGIFPGPDGWGALQFFVPIDDVSTRFFYVQFRRDGSSIPNDDHHQIAEIAGLRMGRDIDLEFNKVATRDNNWLQDRGNMTKGSGLRGVVIEDAAIQESMGPVV